MDGGHGERKPGENGEGIKSQHQGFQTLKDVMSTQLKLFIDKGCEIVLLSCPERLYIIL